MSYPSSLSRLIRALMRLPGVGPKTAERLSLGLLRLPKDEVKALGRTIAEIAEKVLRCQECGNFSDAPRCAICIDPKRDRTTICVVAEPQDLTAIERTHEFKGVYHVLGGLINAVEGVGPEQLTIQNLLARLLPPSSVVPINFTIVKNIGTAELSVKEIILALDATVEGESTANYLAKLLKPLGMRVTRLARGLPMGSNLEFADEVTLTNALQGRREI